MRQGRKRRKKKKRKRGRTVVESHTRMWLM